ncbi:8975_t:CDS:2 [Entrophospora sp. SA101]|nr:8975_t:CDS:2 [Entrophospora sp. SA101]CAJ0851492.1 14353_t:CDS:2 [Entrophospora sp. SA101]
MPLKTPYKVSSRFSVHNNKTEAREAEESIFIDMTLKSRGHLSTIDGSGSFDKRIIILLILSPLWTLIFTMIPVVADFHGIVAHIYRFVEPVVGLPLSYFIISSSRLFNDDEFGSQNFFLKLSEKNFLMLIFMIGAAIYAQGAGMHSTGVIAKQELIKVLEGNPEMATQYPVLSNLVDYYRETIEHVAGHYLYAFGSVLMSWSQILAFRNQIHIEIKSKIYLTLWIFSAFFYSLLLAGVSIEFPKEQEIYSTEAENWCYNLI